MGKIKIGGQFSGVGAFDFSLKSLGIEFVNVCQVEIDKYARKSYLANHGTSNDVELLKHPDVIFCDDIYFRHIDKKLKRPTFYEYRKLLKIQEETARLFSFYYPWNVKKQITNEDSLDVAMFSPPCQSFSLAGQRGGKDDLKGRGVLFFNSLEFISINKPRFFIFENVKGLLSADGGATFGEWVRLLGGKSVNNNHVLFPDEDSVPYHIYYKVLNAKHYGVPQNRERVFIVGIRDDQDNVFTWPKEILLIKRLKDVLEKEVDEKYYLSEKMMSYFETRASNFNNGKINFKNENHIASTIIASSGIDISDNILKLGFINQDTQASQVYSSEGVSPNICAGTHGYANGYITDTPKILQKGRGFNQGGEHEICTSITSNSWQENNYLLENIIRKLTPTECFRLMGMYEFKKVVSDSQLYKQAGNSIVVDVLAAIISKLKIN